MPQGGTLVLSTEEVAVGEGHPVLLPGRYAMLRVADTGIGMDAPTLARAFEPFFTTKEVGKGTGLGLSVARGIMTQSRGHIEAESEPGKGSTFRIYLPVTEGSPETEHRDTPAAAGGSETLLLVEDEPDVLDVTRRSLEGLGYRVLTAASGAEALERLAAAGAVHVLLTDVVMPGMDGQELACRALKDQPLLRVVFLSGHPPEAVCRRDSPHHVFVRKPVPPALLARKVREALDGAPVS
jgi:CheY-like chemotaxis protein